MGERPAQDHRLVKAALSGEPDAFTELVRQHQDLVAGVAWRYGTPREEIEDVISEVFIKVYENLARYRPDHPFSTWLYRVAANHVMDRQRKRRREIPCGDLAEGRAATHGGAQQRLERRERARLLRSALADLDPLYRRPLFLVYIEGQSLRTAAQMLGLRENTMKVRLLRGRRALARILADRYPDYFGEGVSLAL
ncbi:MAG: sigma-70 family RNA polymerase sigma factor [Acidobacteriota bacterium]|nr:sigma-70 family RNA polymerase sigma factor [Acidobacteriota bacterium]MDQ7088691.1 sigma-70 family RNA polymerase sigma factor [Acidobacteriota bacterium]